MDAVLKAERPVMPEVPSSPQDIVAEANHRIANSLTLLVSMVRLQASAVGRNAVPLGNAEARMLLEGIAARINAISQLHRMLSHVGDDCVTSLKPHLQEVTDALIAAFSSPEQSVRFRHAGQDCLVQMRKVQPLILIICEIFINAMKYAHPGRAPLQMTLDCSIAPDGNLTITAGDDGVGLPEGFDAQRQGGLGFRVIRALAAELGARLEIISGSLGLAFRLTLPAAAVPGSRLS